MCVYRLLLFTFVLGLGDSLFRGLPFKQLCMYPPSLPLHLGSNTEVFRTNGMLGIEYPVIQ